MQLKSGKAFDEIRKHRGWSLERLGAEAGVGKSFMSQLIGGTKGCTYVTAVLLVAALNRNLGGNDKILSVEQLFLEKIEPARTAASEPATGDDLKASA